VLRRRGAGFVPTAGTCLRPAQRHHLARRPGSGHRPGDRRLLPAPPPPGVPRFLRKVAAAYPRTELRVICDNYAVHKHADVRAWLARNPRITLQFTPAGCSWLNLVECFFSIITRQAIRRGSCTSVPQLTHTTGAFIGGWNDHPRPFTWTKNTQEILGKIHRAKTKTNGLTDH